MLHLHLNPETESNQGQCDIIKKMKLFFKLIFGLKFFIMLNIIEYYLKSLIWAIK